MNHTIQFARPEDILGPEDLDDFKATGKPFVISCWSCFYTADTLREALTVAEHYAETSEVPIYICSTGLVMIPCW